MSTDNGNIIEPQFDNVFYIGNKLAGVKLGKKWGLIQTDGTYLFDPQFSDVDEFGDGNVIVTNDGAHGVLRPDGKWLIPLDINNSYIEYEPGSVVRILRRDNDKSEFIDLYTGEKTAKPPFWD